MKNRKITRTLHCRSVSWTDSSSEDTSSVIQSCQRSNQFLRNLGKRVETKSQNPKNAHEKITRNTDQIEMTKGSIDHETVLYTCPILPYIHFCRLETPV